MCRSLQSFLYKYTEFLKHAISMHRTISVELKKKKSITVFFKKMRINFKLMRTVFQIVEKYFQITLWEIYPDKI
jgi:hypothetical protein